MFMVLMIIKKKVFEIKCIFKNNSYINDLELNQGFAGWLQKNITTNVKKKIHYYQVENEWGEEMPDDGLVSCSVKSFYTNAACQ